MIYPFNHYIAHSLLHCFAGVLSSSYKPWNDILQEYGNINGSSMIETFIRPEEVAITLPDIEKGACLNHTHFYIVQ